MSIPFHCPHCQLFTLVDDEYAGHTGPCAGCGKLVTIPVPQGSTGSQVSPSSRGAHFRSGNNLRVVMIVVGCVLVSAALITVVSFLAFPTVRLATQAHDKNACSANLRKIGLALAQYHQQYGAYPPSVVTDAAGKPLHSWRVLILPFLGYEDIYKRYHFDEPWDGASNSLLMRTVKMPSEFACSADLDAVIARETSYVAVVGPKCVFRTKGVVKRTDITDMPEYTLGIVERHETKITWMEPKDMTLSELRFDVDGLGTGIGGNHDGGVNVLMMDHQVRFLSEDVTEEHLQAMATIDGGESIPWEALE